MVQINDVHLINAKILIETKVSPCDDVDDNRLPISGLKNLITTTPVKDCLI